MQANIDVYDGGKSYVLRAADGDMTVPNARRFTRAQPRNTMGPNPRGCFLEDTKVLLEDSSYKNIQDIKVGERVTAYDIEKDIPVNATITTTFIRNETKYRIIEYGLAGKLKVTQEHPFLVDDEWIPASDLEIGDELTTIDGKKVRITNIQDIETQEPFLVYNLEADPYHDFVVSEDNLVVHNSDALINVKRNNFIRRIKKVLGTNRPTMPDVEFKAHIDSIPHESANDVIARLRPQIDRYQDPRIRRVLEGEIRYLVEEHHTRFIVDDSLVESRYPKSGGFFVKKKNIIVMKSTGKQALNHETIHVIQERVFHGSFVDLYHEIIEYPLIIRWQDEVGKVYVGERFIGTVRGGSVLDSQGRMRSLSGFLDEFTAYYITSYLDLVDNGKIVNIDDAIKLARETYANTMYQPIYSHLVRPKPDVQFIPLTIKGRAYLDSKSLLTGAGIGTSIAGPPAALILKDAYDRRHIAEERPNMGEDWVYYCDDENDEGACINVVNYYTPQENDTWE